MKTKIIKFKIIFCVLSGIMLFEGCRSDLLDTVPYYAVSSGNVWNSAGLATQVVTGVYNRVRDEYSGLASNYPYWENFSSNTDYHPAWISYLNLLQGNATPSSTHFSTVWKRYYEGIHRANDVIANIDKVPDMSDALKAQYKAECKFLRAYFYYRLNALYRGVPIYLEPINAADCTRGRASEQEVWNTILADLTDCINEPNLKNKYASNDTEYGRVTKGAAYSLRGKVYLWLNEYVKAEQDFRAVTTMGFSLFSDYKALFKQANERCDEMIFSVQAIAENGLHTCINVYYGNRMTPGTWGYNAIIINDAFVGSFDCADGKKFDWEDYLPGYSSMTPNARSVFFLRDNMTAAEITRMTNYGADMSQYLPDGNEARIKAVYDNRDPRLALNVITPYSTFLGGVTGTAINYTLRWPYRGYDDAEPYDIRTDTNSAFYYLGRKFVPEAREVLDYICPIDIPLIRYADVLLNLAEALNEQGKTNEAITYVNQVRARVGAQLLNTNTYTTVTGQDNMRERIRNERYWELCFEEHAYFDELRWGTWKEKKFFPGSGLKQIWGTTTYSYRWVGDHLWTWPIPASEMQMNSNLTQNPGWVN
jgi:tetratricopeptide (TPR) repeat protein